MSSIWTMRRDTADGKVGGVCAGLARQADIDPVLVRVGAVLLALSGGIGLVVYGAVWFLTPDERGRTPVDEHLPAVRRWPRTAVILVIVVACIASAGPTPNGSTERPTAGLPPAGPTANPFSGPPTPFTEAAAAWQRRVDEVSQQRPAPTTPAPAAAPVWPVHDPQATPTVYEPGPLDRQEDRHAAFLAQPDPVGLYADPPAPAALPPHRRVAARRLRLISIAVLGLVLAGLAVADAAGAAIGVTSYLAAALLVGGLTLIAAAWLGRARGILPITLVLALATFGSVGASQAHLGDWGERDRVYTSQTELPATDTLTGGSLSVDLSQLPVTRDQSYSATMDYGRLQLTRPAASNVRILWSVDSGLVTLPDGSTQTGRPLSGTIEPTGVQPGDPVLTITVHVDRGALEVRR